MLVSVPPQLAPAKLVQYPKGLSSRMLQDEFPQLKSATEADTYGRGGTFARACARSERDQDNAIGAWPERGLLETQIGPNKNGRKW